ncbi:MAG: dimethylargininase, partial [Pyrinomonadaceae bacterium]|nr:dimethylargininase [Pyrinomonadaceae bacterium]
MITAITHRPSSKLTECNLTFLPKSQIDLKLALDQHKVYCQTLEDLGIKVITLTENSSMPDSVFVEDTALVLDEIAIITSMGASSRKPESALIENTLKEFRNTERISPPARIDGGDVLRLGKKLFVGNSTRTNKKAVRALHKLVSPYGYEVIRVKVSDCLHLKTGCSSLDDNTILINPDWINRDSFKEFKQIEVPVDEPFAGCVLRVGDTVLMHSGFKRTIKLVEKYGFNVRPIDISEFQKAEAGITCMSIIFEAD